MGRYLNNNSEIFLPTIQQLYRKMQEGASTQILTGNSRTASVLPQYLAAISATFGGFVMGNVLGWTSPAGPNMASYGYNHVIPKVTEIENSLISGLMAIGAIVGAGVAGPISDMAGRRISLMAQLIPALIGWALMIWARSVVMMYIGRIFLGFISGFHSVVAPMYTNEISETRIKGTLGVLFQLNCTLGILYTYVVGAFVSVYWLSLTCGIFPIINCIMMFLMPESPRYYLIKDRPDDAQKSLQWLRGKQYDVKQELQETEDSVQKTKEEKLSISQAFRTRAAKKGLIIGLGIMFFQQFSGINAVIFFTTQIFKDAGSSLSADLATIIVGCINVGMTFVSAVIVDRLGRKPLLFISASIMALAALVLGVYFFIKDSGVGNTEQAESYANLAKNIGWLPLLCVSLFIVVFALGFGPIPWMLMAEIFPAAVRGPASSIACLFNWVGVFIITMCFNPAKTAIGVHGAEVLFWIFACISVLAAIFVWTVVPETKGKTIDEVTAVLSGETLKNESNVKQKTSL